MSVVYIVASILIPDQTGYGLASADVYLWYL